MVTRIFGALLFIILNVSFDSRPAKCVTCSISILSATQQNLEKLKKQEIDDFICTIDERCRPNVEFSEFSSELLYDILLRSPKLFLRSLGQAESEKREFILRRLASQ